MHNFKKIKKPLICIILFLLIVKMLDILLYPCTFMRNDIHTVTTSKNDVIFLGTSLGKMNLDPDVILSGTEKTGHNLCVGGEYTVDAYYLAKLAIEKQKPETIIFEVDPGYFVSQKESGNNYLLFYHEFPLSLAKLEYYADTILECDFRSTLFPFYEYPLSYEVSKMKDTAYQKITRNYDVSYLKGKAQEYHENGFIERYPVDVSQLSQKISSSFSLSELKTDNIKYLDKLIELCKENDVEFVAASTPLPAVTLVNYQENFKEAWDYFSEYFRQKGVDYYNFNREYFDAFPHSIENYTDYDGHMNGDGARAFSQVFGDVVVKKN